MDKDNNTTVPMVVRKDPNRPKRIYRYRSYNPKSIAGLEKNSIWFSNPLKLNDPYESARKWTHPIYSFNDVIEITERFIEQGKLPEAIRNK